MRLQLLFLFCGITKAVSVVLVSHRRGRGARRAAIGIRRRRRQVEAEAETNQVCFLLPLLDQVCAPLHPRFPSFLIAIICRVTGGCHVSWDRLPSFILKSEIIFHDYRCSESILTDRPSPQISNFWSFDTSTCHSTTIKIDSAT